MPSFPPPPSGSEKYGDDIPASITSAWNNLSGPEQVWHRFRATSFFSQLIWWLVLSPLIIGLWAVKNMTSKTSSTGLKVVSGLIVALFVLSLFA